VPHAAYHSCSGAFVSQTERAYRTQAKLAPTKSDQQPNSHTQPWYAV